jgi:hypothetical protein
MSRRQAYVDSLIQANRLLGGRKGGLQCLRGAILAHERAGFSINDFIETMAPTPQNHRA